VQILIIEVSRGAPHLSKSAPASTIRLSSAKTLISAGILSAKASKFNQVQGMDSGSGLARGFGGLAPRRRTVPRYDGEREETLAPLVVYGRGMAFGGAIHIS